MAKSRAPRGETSPRTRGRLRVRDMSASNFGSNIMFSVLALQQDRNVPTVRYIKVRVEVERVGSGVMAGSRVSRDEIGYIPYAEVVVRTIRKESRGFVRARYAANLRRREVVGSAEENFDSCAEASGGRLPSGSTAALPCSFKRFRRRCGSSSGVASVAIAAGDAAAVDELSSLAVISLGGEEAVELLFAFAGASEDNNPTLLFDLSYNRLAERYDL